MLKKFIAEFLGTFILVLAVSFSLGGTFPVPTPVIAALAIGVSVYTLGGISGAHFNPAITLGVLFMDKISFRGALMYLSAQLLAAAAATLVARQMVTVPDLPVADTVMVFMSEMLGVAILAIGVASVTLGNASPGASGLVVGGSLLLGISLAAVGSNGVLNPAVALGIGSFSISYLVAPIAGSALAMLAYKHLLN